MDLILKLCENQDITFSVFGPKKLASKFLEIHGILALNNARFK